MGELNKEEKAISIAVKIMVVAIVFFGILAATSNKPKQDTSMIEEICWTKECNEFEIY